MTDQKPRRFVVSLAGTAILAVLCGGLGYAIGLRQERPMPAGTSCDLRPPPTEDMAARNRMWRAANGERPEPPTVEHLMGAAVAVMLAPNSTVEQRNAAMDYYLQKGGTFIQNEAEAQEFQRTLNGDDQAKRLTLLRLMSGHDSRAARMIGQMLADQKRLELLMSGKQVPLESRPDGTVP